MFTKIKNLFIRKPDVKKILELYDQLFDITIDIVKNAKYDNYTDLDFHNYVVDHVEDNLNELTIASSQDVAFCGLSHSEIYKQLELEKREEFTKDALQSVQYIKHSLKLKSTLEVKQKALVNKLAREIKVSSKLPAHELIKIASNYTN